LFISATFNAVGPDSRVGVPSPVDFEMRTRSRDIEAAAALVLEMVVAAGVIWVIKTAIERTRILILFNEEFPGSRFILIPLG
jgi:hypothetical protein